MSKRLARFLEQSKSRPDYRKKVHQAETAADLRILIAGSGKSFKEIAAIVGISPAALSKKLGGEANLTLDSILAIAQAVGADFDIVFRPQDVSRYPQQWEIAAQARSVINEAMVLFEQVKVAHAEIEAMRETTKEIARASFRNARPQVDMANYTFVSSAANDHMINERWAANGN